MTGLFKRVINKTIREPEMTIVAGTAVALGVAYACVIPWFYCKPDVSDGMFISLTFYHAFFIQSLLCISEEPRVNNFTEPKETSPANRTLTSTTVRITGLRGLNIVAVTMPNQPSMSEVNEQSNTTGLRSYLKQTQNKNKSPSAQIKQFNVRQLPKIQQRSQSLDSSVHENSSEIVMSGSSLARAQQYRSNNSRKIYQVPDEVTIEPRIKIKKPPRAHPPAKQFSANSISTARNFLPGRTNYNAQTQTENSMDKETSRTSDFVGHRIFHDVSCASSNYELKTRNTNLYPAVTVEVCGCLSPATTPPRSSTVSPVTPKNSDKIENKKSNVSKFFTKKWKQLSLSFKRSNDTQQSKSLITPVTIPSGHSTLNQPVNLSGASQGRLNRHKTGAKIYCNEDLPHERERTKVLSLTRGMSSCVIHDHVTINKNNNKTYSHVDTTMNNNNRKPIMCRTEIEDYYDEEPLDLSCKSTTQQNDQDNESNPSTCTAFVRDIHQVVQGVDNYLKVAKRTEPYSPNFPINNFDLPEIHNSPIKSQLKLRKCTSLNFFNNKLDTSKKCQSLPEKNYRKISQKISQKTTNFRDVDSFEQISMDYNPASIFEEYIAQTILEDETQYLGLEQMGNARHIFKHH